MNKYERIQATLRHEPTDRVPLSLWRHFHRQDRSAPDLAEAPLALADEYDLDLVKLTPSGLYAVEDWAGDRIVYPGTEANPPYLASPAIAEPGAWRRLPALDPAAGALGRELETIRLVAAGLDGSRPFVMTIFSPLTLALKLAGEAVVHHLRQQPLDLHAGLEIMTGTTVLFAQAALEAGADGIFFASQLASRQMLAPGEYKEFGVAYDSVVLEAIAGRSALTVLHLHGQDIFFGLANSYPIDAVSWHDQETPPSLVEARRLTERAFLTGLDRELLGRGPIDAIRAQVRQALGRSQQRGLILAPSCVIPPTAPEAHLRAVYHAIREYR
jgi:uroporphyrinogen decarboxylase